MAIRDGYDLLEIEFPPLPANVLELDDVSAYDVAQANLKLALDLARGFIKTTSEDQKLPSCFRMSQKPRLLSNP